jgi:hypothetical protein
VPPAGATANRENAAVSLAATAISPAVADAEAYDMLVRFAAAGVRRKGDVALLAALSRKLAVAKVDGRFYQHSVFLLF